MVQVRSGSSTGEMDHRRCEAPQRRNLCPPRWTDDQWHFTARQRRTSPRLDSPGGETDPGRIDRRRFPISGPVQSARGLNPRTPSKLEVSRLLAGVSLGTGLVQILLELFEFIAFAEVFCSITLRLPFLAPQYFRILARNCRVTSDTGLSSTCDGGPHSIIWPPLKSAI